MADRKVRRGEMSCPAALYETRRRPIGHEVDHEV
jgi:hypothetical protein